MEEEEIKERLSCYRPGKDDPNDPEFAGALKAIEDNRVLKEWFDEQLAVDTAIRAKLSASPIPKGLLAGLKQKEGEPAFAETETDSVGDVGEDQDAKPIRFPMWSRLAAAAAILVASLFAVNLLGKANAQVERFREAMALEVSHGIVPEHLGADMEKLCELIASKGAPTIESCPSCIEKCEGVGCKVFEWKDQSVSIVCFKKDTNEMVHLFIVKRETLEARIGAKIPVAKREGFQTGGWIDSENVYILVGGSKGVSVKELLK